MTDPEHVEKANELLEKLDGLLPRQALQVLGVTIGLYADAAKIDVPDAVELIEQVAMLTAEKCEDGTMRPEVAGNA